MSTKPYIFAVENAKSAQSKCKLCKEKIEKGGLRIGVITLGAEKVGMTEFEKEFPSAGAVALTTQKHMDTCEDLFDQEGWLWRWYHLNCFKFDRYPALKDTACFCVKSPFTALSKADQTIVQKAMGGKPAAKAAAKGKAKAKAKAEPAAPAVTPMPPMDVQHAFLDAAKQYEVEKVKGMLEKWPKLVDAQPCGRWSALHQFSEAGDVDTVKYLMARGADVTVVTSDGKTPKEVADNAEIISLLEEPPAKKARVSEPEAEDEDEDEDEEECGERKAADGYGAADGEPDAKTLLSGLTLVFTGTLTTPRKEMTAKATAAGANVTSAISKSTHVLVAGPGAGSKLAQAAAWGIEVWDEAKFRKVVGLDGGGVEAGGEDEGAGRKAAAEDEDEAGGGRKAAAEDEDEDEGGGRKAADKDEGGGRGAADEDEDEGGGRGAAAEEEDEDEAPPARCEAKGVDEDEAVGKADRKNAEDTPDLSGKTLVFTGTLSTPRKEMTAKAAAAGAKVTSAISKSTHVLVAGPGAGSKLAQAAAWGIEVWDEAKFRKAVGLD